MEDKTNDSTSFKDPSIVAIDETINIDIDEKKAPLPPVEAGFKEVYDMVNVTNTKIMDDTNTDGEENYDNFLVDSEDEILSNSEDENEEFLPSLYQFNLTDALGNNIYSTPELTTNMEIVCPSFYKILDHTLAVIWMLYSGKNSNKLQSSHVQWALKFLEGLKDKHNKRTPDVEMAIDHLQTALIDICANVDIDVFEEKIRKQYTSTPFKTELSSTEQKTGNNSYDVFTEFLDKNNTDATKESEFQETNVNEKNVEASTSNNNTESDKNDKEKPFSKPSPIKFDENRDQSIAMCKALKRQLRAETGIEISSDEEVSENKNKELYSFILKDMLGDSGSDNLHDILNVSASAYQPSQSIGNFESNPSTTSYQKAIENNEHRIFEDIAKWKDTEYLKMMEQLKRMKSLDEVVKNLNCIGSSDIIAKLEKFINQD